MAITEVEGRKFIQLAFSSVDPTSPWTMGQDRMVRSVRLTAPPGKLADTDFITFQEEHGAYPKIFTLSKDAMATFFHGSQSTRLLIARGNYQLTNPADVIVSIEVD